MQALGKDIAVAWFEAGQGAVTVEQRLAHHDRMLRFAQRGLGGEAGPRTSTTAPKAA